MAAQAKTKPDSTRPGRAKPKTFHATMLVTRVEEWCVDADTPEEAQRLLASGQGHRCHHGDSLHVEFDKLLED